MEAQKRAVGCRSWLRTCWVGCIQSSGSHLQQERRPERGGAAGGWQMAPLPPDPSTAEIWSGRAIMCRWPSWWDSPALGSGFHRSCWGRALPRIGKGCRIAGAAGEGQSHRRGWSCQPGDGTTGGSVPGKAARPLLSLARGVSGAARSPHFALLQLPFGLDSLPGGCAAGSQDPVCPAGHCLQGFVRDRAFLGWEVTVHRPGKQHRGRCQAGVSGCMEAGAPGWPGGVSIGLLCRVM